MADEPPNPLDDIKDPSELTDADWAEINKLRAAYETGGQEALSAALDELAHDPVRSIRVLAAFFPEMVRESIKDEMAEKGVTEDDIRELIRKLESPSMKQH
jgi:hypothetical protein